jgi:hypothetical protein
MTGVGSVILKSTCGFAVTWARWKRGEGRRETITPARSAKRPMGRSRAGQCKRRENIRKTKGKRNY